MILFIKRFYFADFGVITCELSWLQKYAQYIWLAFVLLFRTQNVFAVSDLFIHMYMQVGMYVYLNLLCLFCVTVV